MEHLSFGSSNQENQPTNTDIAREKIGAAWGSTRDQLGSPNAHRLAELLYKGLYQPEDIEEGEVINGMGFDRDGILRTPLEAKVNEVPPEGKFIARVRRAITNETDFRDCVYEGAIQSIRELAAKGPIRIWTAGDVFGFAEEGYEGSGEQYKKAVAAGLNDLRREIAAESGLDPHDILAVHGAEDKFPLLKTILEDFKKEGITTSFVIDDKSKNLLTAQEIATELNVDIIPILVTTREEPRQDLHSVSSLTEAASLTETLTRDEKLGFVVDYDGVISDDKKKERLQVEAVVHALESEGWI